MNSGAGNIQAISSGGALIITGGARFSTACVSVMNGGKCSTSLSQWRGTNCANWRGTFLYADVVA